MKINDKALAAYASSRQGIDKEGYLNKKGNVNHGYKKRWFVLKGNLLFYFEKPADKQPNGVIILENCSVEVSDCERFSFCVRFQSISAVTRTYILCADSDIEMERWMKRITSASFGYIQMLVKEFEKTLERIKVLEDRRKSELVREGLVADDLNPTPVRPTRKKTDNASNGLDVVQTIILNPSENHNASKLSRLKAKSMSKVRSKSSENLCSDKSPLCTRKANKQTGQKINRVSVPIEPTPNLDEYDDKTTFEFLHSAYGGAIWTKIGETL